MSKAWRLVILVSLVCVRLFGADELHDLGDRITRLEELARERPHIAADYQKLIDGETSVGFQLNRLLVRFFRSFDFVKRIFQVRDRDPAERGDLQPLQQNKVEVAE